MVKRSIKTMKARFGFLIMLRGIVGFRLVRETTNGLVRHSLRQQHQQPDPIPRAAVSVCVRCRDHYLLVQRGKSPNVGMWSFPGGKIEYAESTLEGARRELDEETKGWPCPIQWHPRTFDTTDSFGDGYHYVIAHCYAELNVGTNDLLPPIIAADDAADAKWFPFSEIQSMETSADATPGLSSVIKRAEALLDAGLLDTVTM